MPPINGEELCDLCWDDGAQNVPAAIVIAGVPMCAAHQKTFGKPRHDFETLPVKDDIDKALENRPPKEAEQVHFDTKLSKPAVVSRKLDSGPSKSSVIANRGIGTAFDFADFMSALMCDLVDGNIDPSVAESACWAGDRLLRVVEMQHRLGRELKDGTKILKLTGGSNGTSDHS